MLAAEPTRDKLPDTVLTHAKVSQAVFTNSGDILAADSAVRLPNNNTDHSQKKECFVNRTLKLHIY